MFSRRIFADKRPVSDTPALLTRRRLSYSVDAETGTMVEPVVVDRVTGRRRVPPAALGTAGLRPNNQRVSSRTMRPHPSLRVRTGLRPVPLDETTKSRVMPANAGIQKPRRYQDLSFLSHPQRYPAPPRRVTLDTRFRGYDKSASPDERAFNSSIHGTAAPRPHISASLFCFRRKSLHRKTERSSRRRFDFFRYARPR